MHGHFKKYKCVLCQCVVYIYAGRGQITTCWLVSVHLVCLRKGHSLAWSSFRRRVWPASPMNPAESTSQCWHYKHTLPYLCFVLFCMDSGKQIQVLLFVHQALYQLRYLPSPTNMFVIASLRAFDLLKSHCSAIRSLSQVKDAK